MARYNKFWVALLMLGATLVQANTGIELPLDEENLMYVVQGLTAALVWAVPNK